jgi:hypothetical protein
MTVCQRGRWQRVRAYGWDATQFGVYILTTVSGSAVAVLACACVGMWSSELSADVVRTVVLRRPLKVGRHLPACLPTG